MIKRNFLLSALYITFVLLGHADGFCQTIYSPDQWQTAVASTEDNYNDFSCDTVITRTSGHSITVSCVRDTLLNGKPSRHRIVMRCMNHGRYFTFDMLPFYKDTVYCFDYMYIDNVYYYVRDMRISDSICFFCGTKETHRKYNPMPGGQPPSVPNDEVFHVGFFGRFDMRFIKDSDAVVVPVMPDPGSGSTQPVPVTEWHPMAHIVEVPQTATLDKFWVDNGLSVYGYKNGQIHPQGCPNEDPYIDLSVGIDPDFSIFDAKAYIIGRQLWNMSRSCMVEIESGLDLISTSIHYKVWEPPMTYEMFTDVTANDSRVLFSSRIFQGTTVGENAYLPTYTIGIRYKDYYSGDDDYLSHLHLYSHQGQRSEYQLDYDEYAHLSRLKNQKNWSPLNGWVWFCKDFCFVYTCKRSLNSPYDPNTCKTFIQHIDMDMNVNVAFELGGMVWQYSGYGSGGYRIKDVCYIGNYRMNCLALAYNLDNSRSSPNGPYIELIDWGYKMGNIPSYLHIGDPSYDYSVRLKTESWANSLDVFLDGYTFSIGGKTSNGKLLLTTQKRSSIQGSDTDVACKETYHINNYETFTVSHDAVDWELSKIADTHEDWLQIFPVATKHPVTKKCTKEPKRESPSAESDSDEVEQ